MPDQNRVPVPPGPSPTPTPAATRLAQWNLDIANSFGETMEGLETPLNAGDLCAFIEGLVVILTPEE